MAVPFQSTSDEDAVGASLESVQHLDDLHSPAARQYHHFDVGRVLQSQRAGQVGSSVGTVLAAKGEDLGFEVCGHAVFLNHR